MRALSSPRAPVRSAPTSRVRRNSVPASCAPVRSAPVRSALEKMRPRQIRIAEIRSFRLDPVEVGVFQPRVGKIGTGEVCPFQIDAFHLRPAKRRAIGTHAHQKREPEVRIHKARPGQIGIGHVGIAQIGIVDTRGGEVCLFQIDTAHRRPCHIGACEVGPLHLRAAKIRTAQVCLYQRRLLEVGLAQDRIGQVRLVDGNPAQFRQPQVAPRATAGVLEAFHRGLRGRGEPHRQTGAQRETDDGRNNMRDRKCASHGILSRWCSSPRGGL